MHESTSKQMQELMNQLRTNTKTATSQRQERPYNARSNTDETTEGDP